MESRRTRAFDELYDQLPARIRDAADEQYALWRADPFHPSLQFKEVKPEIWSARVTGSYRTLGRRRRDEPGLILWFWIGTHGDYDKLLDG